MLQRLWSLFRPRPSFEWEPWKEYSPKALVTGETAKGLLMRRFVDGKWQYRRPTAEEAFDHMERQAW